MDRVAYYHHPDDEQLSLDFTAPSLEKAEERVDSYDEEVLSRIEKCEFDQKVFFVYKGRPTPDYVEDLEYDLFEQVKEMEEDDRIIVTRLLGIFESIIDEKYEQEEEKLAAYKEIEVDEIPEALDNVDWDASVAEVGGSLVSALILKHALPNANHRTSIAMLRVYYEAVSSQFDMPSTATDEYEWKPWVNEFIEESKRIITVRRNSLRFHYLNQAGCNVVERKDGLRMHLNEYDLSMNPYEAQKHYAEMHTDRCIEFARQVLDEAKNPELIRGKALDKSAFAQRIQSME